MGYIWIKYNEEIRCQVLYLGDIEKSLAKSKEKETNKPSNSAGENYIEFLFILMRFVIAIQLLRLNISNGLQMLGVDLNSLL